MTGSLLLCVLALGWIVYDWDTYRPYLRVARLALRRRILRIGVVRRWFGPPITLIEQRRSAWTVHDMRRHTAGNDAA